MEQEKQLHWFPGHMMKAMRAIEAKLPIIDVVVEILDARAVKASRSLVLEKLIKNKTRIIILNKADLADEKITKLWSDYFQAQGFYVITAKSLTTKMKPILVSIINEALKTKITNQIAKGIKNPQIKVLVLGLPNVGKSTFINNLLQRKVTRTANCPGVTRGQQWVKLSPMIDLLDSPGILPPKVADDETKFILSLIQSLPSKHLFLDDIAIFLLQFLLENYRDNLVQYYKINFDSNFDKESLLGFFHQLAQKYHFKMLNNEDNVHRAMNLFVHDFQSGKLGLVSFEQPES